MTRSSMMEFRIMLNYFKPRSHMPCAACKWKRKLLWKNSQQKESEALHMRHDKNGHLQSDSWKKSDIEASTPEPQR